MQITSCSYSSCFSCFVFSYPSCRCGLTGGAVLAFAGSAGELMASTGSTEVLMAFAGSAGAMEPLAFHHFPSVACWTTLMPLPTCRLLPFS